MHQRALVVDADGWSREASVLRVLCCARENCRAPAKLVFCGTRLNTVGYTDFCPKTFSANFFSSCSTLTKLQLSTHFTYDDETYFIGFALMSSIGSCKQISSTCENTVGYINFYPNTN